MAHANRHYVVTLAVAAAAILIIGSLMRPAPVADDPQPPAPSQAELSRLAHLAQRRSLESMKEYFATVAGNVDRSVVRLRMLGRSGIVWEPEVVVTARLEHRLPPTTTMSADEGELGVVLLGSGPHLPLAALRIPSSGGFLPVRRRAPTEIDPGSWTVFVAERDRAGFTPATYVETSRTPCHAQTVGEVVTSVALTRELAGAGLFDLDGNLLAVVLECDGRFAAVPVDDVDALVRQAVSVHGRIVQRYGMGLDALTQEEQGHLGVPFGLLVREVWTGSLADAVGLRPGDVVIAINAELILEVDQLEPLVEADGETPPYDVAVVRDNDTVRLSLPSAVFPLTARDAGTAVEGLVWEDPDHGHRIDAVLPGTPSAAAGLRSGDRLLRIDGDAPDDLDAVREALSPTRETPVMLELERGRRRWAVVLP